MTAGSGWAPDEAAEVARPQAVEASERAAEPAPGGQTTYDDNRQRVGNGVGVMGVVHGSVNHTNNYYAVVDDEADGKITKPRFREGPYPAEEVGDRLRGFVETQSYAPCKEALLGRRVLLLRGESGSGTSTAAFALVQDVTGKGRVIGLDSSTDLTSWSPSTSGGYVVQGIAPEAGGRLDEVAFNQLTDHLRVKDAYLIVVVNRMTALPRAAAPWCRDHYAPSPRDVARARLKALADEGALSAEELRKAVGALELFPFKDYLEAGRRPIAGVEVAEELREYAANGRTPEAAAVNLRVGTAEAAGELLAGVRHSVGDLALTAAIALLEEQDRSVVERSATLLRPLLEARVTRTLPVAVSDDLLGRDIDARLAKVQARLLPRTAGVVRGRRYWIEPVAFRGRHLGEEVLRRLWLDYEGFSDVLMTWVRELPYEPGVDRVAGQRIGQVLCQASGSHVLQQLAGFAHSSVGWHRRLAAHALGELVQNVVLSAAVRAQLSQWSRAKGTQVRCTVAESCAGSLGLAMPDFALRRLHTILDDKGDSLDDDIYKAVSGALGVMLTEEANRRRIFVRLTAWLAEPRGTARHAYAVRAVHSLCSGGFPSIIRAGIRKVTLAELFADTWESLVPLVLGALDDEQLHEPMKAALATLERSLGPDGDTRMESFIGALAEASGGSRGLRRLFLARLRDSSVRARQLAR
ncbi:hypothetical protein ABT034_30580 [Streptomyces sp. NPDC002773]|uniref:hypothetical protein n=1 Tax=Streptomyces sp. NPDC002773 TaxID=3154430 RepID=UPI00331963C0